MLIRTTPGSLSSEIDAILQQDGAARAEVERRSTDARRHRRYNPRIETLPRLMTSLAQQNIEELRSDYQSFSRTMQCFLATCNEPAVECHQASRSNQLKHIREKGMVYWFDKFRNTYIGAGGPGVIDARHAAVPQPLKVGAKNATTFRGFCGTHDKELFAVADGDQLFNTRDQLLRLLYRAVSYETYWKRWDSSPTKQAIDRVMAGRVTAAMWPREYQHREDSTPDNREEDLVADTLLQQAKDRITCRELDKWMTWIEQKLENAERADVRAVDIRVKGRPFLVCSGLVSAAYDFAEDETLGDVDGVETEGIAIMTTWLHSTKEWSLLLIEAGGTGRRIEQYVRSLTARHAPAEWLERLTTWIMVSCGNIAMNPRWWAQIGDHNQMMSGVILQQHHGDGRGDLTARYWKEPFVGAADIEVCHYP